MRAIQSSIEINSYQREILELLQSDDCAIFLDTNVLAWAFRLNDDAYKEFTKWLEGLAGDDRLFIPAWVAHEYNHHLLRDNPDFFCPHKVLSKQLTRNLSELEKAANLMFSSTATLETGSLGRESLLVELAEASKAIQRCLVHLAEDSKKRRNDLIAYFEKLIDRCVLNSDLHQIAEVASIEAPLRFANRISPGYHDLGKIENSNGDLIIWKELLGHCSLSQVSQAILITNDVKSDWVYTPLNVILPNGKAISASHPNARLVKLPKPDLLAEFEHHTGGKKLRVLSIECAINVLSSSGHHYIAKDFSHLSIAMKLDLEPTPTEVVIQWFLKHPEKYREAMYSVCSWRTSPDEVEQEAFKEWTAKNIGSIDKSDVDWGDVFGELFL